MLIGRGIYALIGAVLMGMISGCWSTPVQVPLGVRADGGVLSFVLPVCFEDQITEAMVTPMDEETFPPPVWQAHGLLGDPSGVVAFDKGSWSEVSGSYAGQVDASYDFTGPRVSVGTTVSSIESVSGLPAGIFDVNGEKMTLDAYRKMVEPELGCKSTGDPTR